MNMYIHFFNELIKLKKAIFMCYVYHIMFQLTILMLFTQNKFIKQDKVIFLGCTKQEPKVYCICWDMHFEFNKIKP